MRALILTMLVAASWPALAADTMTVEDALAQAATGRTELAAVAAETEAAVTEAEQAGAWPNPAAFLRMEAAPRDGDTWAGSERIVGLSQELPLSGRTGASRAVAEARADLARESGVLAGRVVEARVRTAFASALHAQDALTLRQEAVAATGRLHDLVSRRSEAGDTAVADRRRARMELGIAEAELLRAQARVSTTRAELAAAIGSKGALAATLVGSPTTSADVPALGDLLATVQAAPRVRMGAGLVAEQKARITEASRLRWPDLEVEAGLRTAPDGDSFDAGVRLSLPLFDRGGARVSAARAGAAAADHRRRAAEHDLEAQVHEAHAELATSVAELSVYDEIVVPEASAALRSAEAAYTTGDADLTDVLQITRDWIEARQARLDRILAVSLARAELLALL